MAYYSGAANDLAALRGALIDACVNEGWTWDSGNEVLHKATMFVRITVSAISIALLGRTGVSAGAAPNTVRVGRMMSRAGFPTYDITFPAAYELFLFDQEVFMVINYGVDHYQWLCFGKSTVDGLPGTGMWVGASAAEQVVGTQGANKTGPIFITATGGGGQDNNSGNTAALFWSFNATFAPSRNCWLHSDLDGHGWSRAPDGGVGDSFGITPSAPLMEILPNTWNSEAVLLPIRAYKERPSFRLSLTGDIEHARYTRVDNYVPGQIITIGADRWKVFPWFRKNTAARGGGNNINHTGTFGWAIRYEGP